MTMGTTTQAYGEPWYWDNRYAHESGPFDWYQKYPSLAPLIKLYVPSHHQRILIVGCGNSGMSLSLSSLNSRVSNVSPATPSLDLTFLNHNTGSFIFNHVMPRKIFYVELKFLFMKMWLQRLAKAWWMMDMRMW